jgi:hypothetical protein
MRKETPDALYRATTGAQLDRLTNRKGYSVTALIEELTASAERRVTADRE